MKLVCIFLSVDVFQLSFIYFAAKICYYLDKVDGTYSESMFSYLPPWLLVLFLATVVAQVVLLHRTRLK